MDNPADILAVGDGERISDSDSGIRMPLEHSEIFSAALAGIKREPDDDDDSVDSLSRKKLRFGGLGDVLGDSQKSPLTNPSSNHRDVTPVRFKSDQDRASEPTLENILDRRGTPLDSTSPDDMTNAVLDCRKIFGMGSTDAPSSPTIAPQEGHRAQVFGIDFMQVPGSPLRDPPPNNAEDQPLPMNDQGGVQQGGSALHQGVHLHGPTTVEKKNGMGINRQTTHFPAPGGKTLPKLDNSRASLDHPDDDRLVAADTEEPSSIHSPSIVFQNPEVQTSQPIPLQGPAQIVQQNHAQNMAALQQAMFPQLQQNQISAHAGAPTPMLLFGGMRFPHFPPPMQCNMAQQRFLARGYNAPQQPLARPQAAASGIPLALSCDDEQLSEYQVLIRSQLEIFEATQADVESNTQGRKKQVHPGQVGLRCRHCAQFPLRERGRGAVYYPARLQGVYQAAQNMASTHLCESCKSIPEPLKQQILGLRERREAAGGGKQYWADGARALGLQETKEGLRLRRRGGS